MRLVGVGTAFQRALVTLIRPRALACAHPLTRHEVTTWRVVTWSCPRARSLKLRRN